MQTYQPRAVRFIELLSIGSWRMKLYGIACRAEFPRPELVTAARAVAARQLSSETQNYHGLGFVCAHDGRSVCFVFVDFWGNENELFHRLFLSPAEDPQRLRAAT